MSAPALEAGALPSLRERSPVCRAPELEKPRQAAPESEEGVEVFPEAAAGGGRAW